ncbi:MAG: hypothetical protein ACLPID_00360 [Beijerinckiaceae bacterium]
MDKLSAERLRYLSRDRESTLVKGTRVQFCGRPNFREWVDSKSDPGWPLLPLTHITSGIVAEDIIRSKKVQIKPCPVFGMHLAYFFYGRPAYRLSHDDVIRSEAACPYCFIFDPILLKNSRAIFAFDTGAYENRLYKHVTSEEMNIRDFCLDRDIARINKLIAHVFGSTEYYLHGDLAQITTAEDGAMNWEFHARAYLQLLNSKGRNEPDDRICSIEIIHSQPVPLKHLLAIVVPHTVWSIREPAPWLKEMADANVLIAPYTYVPGRHAEHYHTLLEVTVYNVFKSWGMMR